MLDQIIVNTKKSKSGEIDGRTAFELYDTYGFPLDLTELILKEKGLTVNHDEFASEMKNQRERSKNAASVETTDWEILKDQEEVEFIGYTTSEADISITRYRKFRSKGKEYYQLVFDKTPFYAESGGQIGDTGYIEAKGEKTKILDTIKENELIVHITKDIPGSPDGTFHAVVDSERRKLISNNHSATHLLHHALRKILGSHVEQKGSLVSPDHLRFDFSHFQKVSDEEIMKIECMVNEMVRKNLEQKATANIRMVEAKEAGAIALFGEKYGEKVRTVQFGDSVELCGGIHVPSTGQIGLFKIISESAIAAGIRRIEAITGSKAESYINDQLNLLKEIGNHIKGSKDILQDIRTLVKQNSQLNKRLESFERDRIKLVKKGLISKIIQVDDMNVIAEEILVSSADGMKDLAFQLKREIENLVLILGTELNGKANLAIMLSDNLVTDRGLNASEMIKTVAKEINGGGGGQPFFATAGGSNPSGIQKAIQLAKKIVTEL
jgi:alanyl-tRNA synthetase